MRIASTLIKWLKGFNSGRRIIAELFCSFLLLWWLTLYTYCLFKSKVNDQVQERQIIQFQLNPGCFSSGQVKNIVQQFILAPGLQDQRIHFFSISLSDQHT